MQHVTATILMEKDLRVTRKTLHARISAAQKSEDPFLSDQSDKYH